MIYVPFFGQPQTNTPPPGVASTSTTPSLPVVFRTSTDCPIPTEWLIGAVLVGLALGFAFWGKR